MSNDIFPGRVGLQQRVIPSYRAEFIETLANGCQGGLSVFAGEPLPVEGIDFLKNLHGIYFVEAENRYFRDPSSALFMCWQGGLSSWLKEWKPDILIVEANPRYPSNRNAIAWMHRNGGKVIGWGLGAPPIGGLSSALRKWERWSLLRSLDAIIAYSKLGAEQYRGQGLSTEKVYVAPNAVSKASISPPPQKNVQADARTTILFVGRLQARKRVDLLLQACSKLPAELQPHLVIVGDGPARDELQIFANLIYPGAEFVGAKHKHEIEPYFQNADLFVLPGTGGLAIQQAMAHGLPIIVAKGDGTQDDLVRPENGWQIPPDELEALIQALQSALSDPSRLRQMGQASYRIVADEINIESMAGVFIQAMNDVRKGQK